MKLAVIDGQGGGIGKAIVEKLAKEFGERIEIIALGTNSTATSGMIKSGAHSGATGENAIRVMANNVDIIMGPFAILIKDAMMGEITSVMTEAIATSTALKLVIPLNRCNMIIPGTRELKLNDLIELAIEEIRKLMK